MSPTQIGAAVTSRLSQSVPAHSRQESVFSSQLIGAIRDSNAKQIRELAEKAKKDNKLNPTAMELRDLLRQAICTGKDREVLRALTEFPQFDANVSDPNDPAHKRTLLSIAAEAKNIGFCRDLLKKGANVDTASLAPNMMTALKAAEVIDHISPLLPKSGPGATPLTSALAQYDTGGMYRQLKVMGGKLPFNEENFESHWNLALQKDRPDMACAMLALAKPEWFQSRSMPDHAELCNWLRDYEKDRKSAATVSVAGQRPRASTTSAIHPRLQGQRSLARRGTVSGTSGPQAGNSALEKSFKALLPFRFSDLPMELRAEVIHKAYEQIDSAHEFDHRAGNAEKLALRAVNREFRDGFGTYHFGGRAPEQDGLGDERITAEDAADIAVIVSLAAGKGPQRLALQGSQVADHNLSLLTHSPIQFLKLRGCTSLDGSGFPHLPRNLEEIEIDDAPQLSDAGIANLFDIAGDPSSKRAIKVLNITLADQLTGIGLRRFDQLKELSLTKCEALTPEGMRCIAPSVKDLYLDYSHIKDEHLANLPALEKLETISLRDMEGRPRVPVSTAGLGQFDAEDLDWLQDEEAEAIAAQDAIQQQLADTPLPRLDEVRRPPRQFEWGERQGISGGNVQITDAGVDQFCDRKRFPNLKTIDLTGCLKVSERMIDKLKYDLDVIR